MAERQFGPYRLVRQVAVGGMAEIHLAKTKGIAGFEKYVAVKMIHPNFAEDEQFIQMLVDEAKIAVQLTHGNIAQTFDLGRVGETYYITMEYIDGADLYKLLRAGSEQEFEMPLDICAFVGKEVCAALDYAHRRRDVQGKPLGIVHRDVSPQNVLVSYAGQVKLVDFGIAKATSKARQTAIGVIKGKYYYMSPEQAWGDPIDYRSDIFSAGIVIYEMLTGQMLYLEEDLHKLLAMARAAEIAPPSSLRPNIPRALDQIVMKALAKAPADRYQSAAELSYALEQFLHAHSPHFTTAKLAGVLRNIVGDPVPVADEPDVTLELRDGPQSTNVPAEAVAHAKEELRDENSMIFRMEDLKPGAPAVPVAPVRKVAATPARGQPTPAQPVAATGQLPRAPASPPRNPAGASANPSAPPTSGPRGSGKSTTGQMTSRQPPLAKPVEPATPMGLRPLTKPPAAAPPAAPAGSPPRVAQPVPRVVRNPDHPTREMDPAPNDGTNDLSGFLTYKTPVPPAHSLAARGWSDSANTHGADDELENIGERTLITTAPSAPVPAGTDAGVTLASLARHVLDDDGSEDEVRYDRGPDATMVTRPVAEPTDGDVTHPRGLRKVPAASDAESTIDTIRDGDGDDGDGAEEDEIEEAINAALRDDHERTTKRKGGDKAAPSARTPRAASPAAALSANIHSPAVSELRKPRPSRRTPPDGVPAAKPNVLQQIVSSASSEPMPTPMPTSQRSIPTEPLSPLSLPSASELANGGRAQPPPQPPASPQAAPIRTANMPVAAPSAPPASARPPQAPPPPPLPQPPPIGTPAQAYAAPPQPQYTPPPAYAQPAQPQPLGYPPPPPSAPMPYGAPAAYGTDTFATGEAYPPPGSQPLYDPSYGQLPPHVTPGALYSYTPQHDPFGPAPTPPTLTGQLRISEGDELPAHLRLSSSKRWVVWLFLSAFAVAAAGTGTFFIVRSLRNTAPTVGAIRIDSTPPGADITVDGNRLVDKTPYTIEDLPVGTRHKIVVELAGYTPDSQDVDVPHTGGQIQVPIVLNRTLGKLLVNSTPAGAEIMLDGISRGYTPKPIFDLDMASTKHIELRLKDYQVFVQDLKWPANGELDLDVHLQKQAQK